MPFQSAGEKNEPLRGAASRLSEGVTPPRDLGELFLGFLSIGARSFGGVLPWAYQAMVEERRWLTHADFTETIGLCQVLPGPNLGNASIVLGKRWFGLRGAIVAFLGLFALPYVWVLGLALLYADFASNPILHAAVTGVGAAGGARDDRRLLPRGGDRARVAPHRRAGCGRCRHALIQRRASLILLELGLYFAVLSLLSFGGMSSVLPEMQRYMVDVKGWMSATEFMQLFAVAQAAPGPNVLMSSLVGWKVAGFAGSLVALGAMCGPAAVLAWWVSDLWDRFRDSTWRKLIQRALGPLVVGLVLAGGYVIATPGSPDWRLWLIAGASAAGMLATRLNPLWLMAAGGVAGGLFL